MTTVEKFNCSNKLLRPTDLSLKNSLNSTFCGHPDASERDNKRHVIVHAQSAVQDIRKPTARQCDRAVWSDASAASPIALVFQRGNFAAAVTTMAASSPVLDSRLVMLDSLFSSHNGGVLQSPVSSVFEPTMAAKRPRGNSDGSSSSDSGRSVRRTDAGGVSPNNIDNVDLSNSPNKAKPPKSSSPNAGGTNRGVKRKGGWKFHDLSDESDGLGRKKRAYNHNKLENEILQLYQDRVCIKEVPNPASGKGEHLVVIEPSYISDPDLIKYNSGLRIVFNKKQNTYQLQVLPYTVENGSLSNKTTVFQAVAKMLGENGAVLCPGIARAMLSPQDYLSAQSSSEISSSTNSETTGRAVNGPRFGNPAKDNNDVELNGDRYWGRWKVPNGNDRSSPESNFNMRNNTPVTPTDRLLLTLNKELSKHNRQSLSSTKDNSKSRCLLWHVPTQGGKGKKALWPSEAKWCTNCLSKMMKQ